MSSVKIVESSNKDEFIYKVEALLKDGYKILSANCGFVNSESYDFCNVYQAILILESEAHNE